VRPDVWAVFTKNKPLVELLLGFGADEGAMSVDVFPQPLQVVERKPARAPRPPSAAADPLAARAVAP
jgi:hypothetical protein